MLRSNINSTAVPNGTVTGNVATPCDGIHIQKPCFGYRWLCSVFTVWYHTVRYRTFPPLPTYRSTYFIVPELTVPCHFLPVLRIRTRDPVLI
jgi:hypothetical protein